MMIDTDQLLIKMRLFVLDSMAGFNPTFSCYLLYAFFTASIREFPGFPNFIPEG